MQLGKRKRVLNLFSTQVPIPKICETVGISKATVFRVRKLRTQFKTQQKLQEQN